MAEHLALTVGFTELHNLMKVWRCGKEVEGTAEERSQGAPVHTDVKASVYRLAI